MEETENNICDVFYFLDHYYALSSIFCQDRSTGQCYFYRLVKGVYIQLKRIDKEENLRILYKSLSVLPRFFLHKEMLHLRIEPCTDEQKELLKQYMDFYQEIVRKNTGELVTQIDGHPIDSTMTKVYEVYWSRLN